MPTPSAAPSPLPADRVVAEAFAPSTQRRRILVFAPLAYSTPHFETDLEIAQRHLDLGDEVELILCDGELASCQLNPHREAQRCIQCTSRNLQGAAQLSTSVVVHGATSALTVEDEAQLSRLPRTFPSQEALRAFQFESFDAGLAVLSSLVDFARAPGIDVRAHADLIHRTLHAAVATYLSVTRLLATKLYDRVYVYNGRWSMTRSAVRACAKAGVTCYTHERGADFKKFALHRDVLPQDKGDFRLQTASTWEQARAHPQAHAIGEAFFTDRRRRVEKNWFSYTKQQEIGRVPADWNRTGRRLVCFTSSEFEYAAIGETATGRIYPNQIAGARRIAQLLTADTAALHLWVRVHPNDRGSETAQRWTEAVRSLANVTLILPEENIDSYALLDGAERVLTFGSTMGIEATYWARPAVCADFSFYDGLDAQYEAATEPELVELLTRPDLPPKPREHAIRYGYYLNTFGAPFAHFITETISDYEFKSPFRGRCLKPDYEDLRQRLGEIFQRGEFRRAANIARLCVLHSAADGMAHAILILSLQRANQLGAAITALESAAISAPAQLEPVLKATAKGLLDALQFARARLPAAQFRDFAHRTAAAFQRTAAFASLGKNLALLADRAPGRVAA